MDAEVDDTGEFKLVDPEVDVALDSGIGEVGELGLVDARVDVCR